MTQPKVNNLRSIISQLDGIALQESFKSKDEGYQRILELISHFEPTTDDGISLNRKFRALERYFEAIIRTDSDLQECMSYINECALEDRSIATKFAWIFSSNLFAVVEKQPLVIRQNMIMLLEQNYKSADKFKRTHKLKFYNSIIILGEYYNRTRFSDGDPIKILGASLLQLIMEDLSDASYVADADFARVLLMQIRSNCEILRLQHSAELAKLFFYVRRSIIIHATLKERVKALFLMALDFYFTNFENLDDKLTEMYCTYLEESESDTEESRSNSVTEEEFPNAESDERVDVQHSPEKEQALILVKNELSSSSDDSAVENTPQIKAANKKWSDQVLEDSFENEYVSSSESDANDIINGENNENDELYSYSTAEQAIPGFDLRSKLSSSNPPRPLKPTQSSQIGQKERGNGRQYFEKSVSYTIRKMQQSERNATTTKCEALENGHRGVPQRFRSTERSSARTSRPNYVIKPRSNSGLNDRKLQNNVNERLSNLYIRSNGNIACDQNHGVQMSKSMHSAKYSSVLSQKSPSKYSSQIDCIGLDSKSRAEHQHPQRKSQQSSSRNRRNGNGRLEQQRGGSDHKANHN